jgi:hypothetical protein
MVLQTSNLISPKFDEFYSTVFLKEHQNKWNVGFHMIGTLASVYLLTGVVTGKYHFRHLLAYPFLLTVPGLIGHRLFEPSPQVGDLRILRDDFPAYWFLVGNYVMTWDVLTSFTKTFTSVFLKSNDS